MLANQISAETGMKIPSRLPCGEVQHALSCMLVKGQPRLLPWHEDALRTALVPTNHRC